jgi:hypothetical protein
MVRLCDPSHTLFKKPSLEFLRNFALSFYESSYGLLQPPLAPFIIFAPGNTRLKKHELGQTGVADSGNVSKEIRVVELVVLLSFRCHLVVPLMAVSEHDLNYT